MFADETLCERWVAIRYRAQAYRVSEGAPSSYALCGSLGDGYVYRVAARASSLLFLPVSICLMPTVSRANKVMMTEVVAQSLEAHDRQVVQMSVES